MVSSHLDIVMFASEVRSTFNEKKLGLEQSYDKPILTQVVISYEVYETGRRLVV